MTIGRNGYLLQGIDQIADHIGVSQTTARKLINHGMPARNVCGSWYAHAGNLETWWKAVTMVKSQVEDAEIE